MRYCPECKTDLNADDNIYVMAGVIVGCEHCTQTMWADEYFDGNVLSEQDYIDQALWEQAEDRRIERMMSDV